MTFDAFWQTYDDVKILQSLKQTQKTLENKSKTNTYTRKNEADPLGRP